MGKFYIYNSITEDKKYRELTIVFNPNVHFDFDALERELKEYFSTCHQGSGLVFLHCSNLQEIEQIINENINKILKSIPKVEESFLKENIFYISYGPESFETSKRFLKTNLKEIINQGLANIFIRNGGLVESNGISHHFVFPSGRHSSKFLRTANVLVTKSEIDFIAINTLHLFKTKFENIYCDTLSISVIGYSIINFLKRYGIEHDVNVESFKSYNGLYDEKTKFYNNSIFLISASTSGGLVKYLKESHPEIDSTEMCVLFYLPLESGSELSKERVLCDLTRQERFRYGIEKYDTFKLPAKSCKYCDNHSTAVPILGDSFSLDEPIIHARNIVAKKYITKSIKDFVKLFKCQSGIGSALKVSYSDNSVDRKKYGVYIDYEQIIDNIEKYELHKKKLDAYIRQYVPSSIKYIIHLNDRGSKKLAEYIHTAVKHYSTNTIQIINQADLSQTNIPNGESGAVLIVGSCITNGKNLLYLNRAFRNFEDIRLVFFIGINRISDTTKYKELKSNIQYGLYGSENSAFVEIETLGCDNSNTDTPWEIEIEFLKGIQKGFDEPSRFISDRVSTINSFADVNFKGGSNNIFYPNLKDEELIIRKNSAFFDDNEYYGKVTQSDIYFTISCVINNMRNNKVDGLYQTNFVKNLIDPYIFNRFNDGIIQASILRNALPEELNYSISYQRSTDMFLMLQTIIKHRDELQGEAILEFLLAIAIGKLRLCNDHYYLLISGLGQVEDENVKVFIKPISDIYNESLKYAHH